MSVPSVNSLVSLGTMEPSADRLLDRARSLVQPGQALDVTHVLLAALPAPADELPATHTLIGSALLSQIPQPEVIRALLNVEIKLHAAPAAIPGAISDALRRAAGIWLQASADRKVRVTDAALLWGILSDDNAVTHILRELRLDRAALLDELSRKFQSVVPDADALDGHRPAPRVVPPSIRPGLAPAYLLAAELVRLVRPSLEHRLAGMHAVLMSNVLNVLGSCTRPEIAVLAGRNGTPLDTITNVLADRLASGEIFTGQRLRLARYKSVRVLDMETVCRLGDVPDEPAPEDVLEMAMLQSVEDRAVLVLDRVEVLVGAEQGQAESRVLAQLADPGDALVLGIFELAEQGGASAVTQLDLRSVRLIPSHKYSIPQTLDLLDRYYRPDWATQGFVFAENAFESVLKLEPGAWIELRRKTLPYLCVGLARDAMETVKGGQELVRGIAQMALDALDELRQEAATTEETLRNHFWPVLNEARTDIQGLLEQPIQMENDKYLLTRAHLTAQLICPNDSEFHYPGHVPREIISFRLEDLPPYQ